MELQLKIPKMERGPATCKLPPPLESAEQQAFFELVRRFEERYPVLKCVFAIPNQGMGGRVKNPQTGKWYSLGGQKRVAEGLRAGVPDIFCAHPRLIGDWPDYAMKHGLWIEMKRRGEHLRPDQVEMIKRLRDQGYRCEVCYSCPEAWACLVEYLNLPSNLKVI